MNAIKIKAEEKNIQKIAEAIKTAEGRATVRTIDAADVLRCAEKFQKSLDKMITKKASVGIVCQIDNNAQSFPNAYKYVPESTIFILEVFPSGIFIVGIKRDICKTVVARLRLKPEHTKAIVDFAENHFSL